jgi:hypothetical protein
MTKGVYGKMKINNHFRRFLYKIKEEIMRGHVRSTVMLVMSCLLISCGSTLTIPPQDHPSSARWKSLFAPDLSDAVFPVGIWIFEDGVLTASEDQCIWTDKEFSAFVLDLEFKTADGTNSGVIVHCSDTTNWIPNSVEIQIADDFSEKWAKSPKTWQCGAFFGHKPATKSVVKKPGVWNRCTIACKDRMIYVLLNGVRVNEMNMDLWTSAKLNPDGSEIPAWLSKPVAELNARGRIGLQGKHAGAPIYFRNLRIMEIK